MRNTSAFARFPPRLQEAIASRLGWSSLHPVQEMAGHALLDGKNALILAPTAGGKTEASLFPLLATLMEREPQGVGLIYIAPIKALLYFCRGKKKLLERVDMTADLFKQTSHLQALSIPARLARLRQSHLVGIPLALDCPALHKRPLIV